MVRTIRTDDLLLLFFFFELVINCEVVAAN